MSTDERPGPGGPFEPVDAVLSEGMFSRAPEPGDPLLTIGAFARRSRLSMKALRLYNRLGLLVPAHVDRDSGYRRYRESQLVTARLIAMLRQLDMPLAQVRRIVSTDGPSGAGLLASYWEAAERRFASQRELAAHLGIRLLGNRRAFEMFEIMERDVPEQLVLTEQRHVYVGDLPSWLSEGFGRLHASAQALGGVVAPTFAIYHGEVNQDSDGPVEICVPIGVEHGEAPLAVAARREPAHREAYVRLRKAQVQYPQILSAFDAVAQWIGAKGLTATAAPREIYFTDFMAAGPNDEVCDVAFPIP